MSAKSTGRESLTPARTFRKKRGHVQAIQWTGLNTSDVLAFGEAQVAYSDVNGPHIDVWTFHGRTVALVGDWIVGSGTDFWPCKPDVFERTYEASS